VGSYLGLCPADGIQTDTGGRIMPSAFQLMVWGFWVNFWSEYLPPLLQTAKKTALILNGDIIDGNHHEAVDIVPSVQSQEIAAVNVIKPMIKAAGFDQCFVVRGTEAHGGIGEQSTERIAADIGALKDDATGNCARWELWMETPDNVLMHASHHIGNSSSSGYETSAPKRELDAAMVEASQWGAKLPDIIIRSHRHRYLTVPLAREGDSDRLCVITPGWQLKTPFVYKSDRIRMPHIGGVVIRTRGGEWQLSRKLYKLPQPTIVRL